MDLPPGPALAPGVSGLGRPDALDQPRWSVTAKNVADPCPGGQVEPVGQAGGSVTEQRYCRQGAHWLVTGEAGLRWPFQFVRYHHVWPNDPSKFSFYLRPLAATDAEAQFSPDGKWLAYYSMETGRREIYVQPFPATGARWQISSTGGRQPMWRPDGKELFYVTEDRKLFAVDVRADSHFDFGTPHHLSMALVE